MKMKLAIWLGGGRPLLREHINETLFKAFVTIDSCQYQFLFIIVLGNHLGRAWHRCERSLSWRQ